MSEEKLKVLLNRIADQVLPDSEVLGGASRISESAFYDFTEHLYLMEPQLPDDSDAKLSRIVFDAVLSAVSGSVPMKDSIAGASYDYEGRSEGGYDAYIDRLALGITDNWLTAKFIEGRFFTALINFLEDTFGELPAWNSPEGEKLLRALGEGLIAYFQEFNILDFEPHGDPDDPAQVAKASITEHFDKTDDVAVYGGIVVRSYSTSAPGPGDLSIYKAGTVNFGLQPVYRQVWQPLGVQTGEIVKTLPLGPKQTERLSFKTVRRTKSTSTTEIIEVTESAEETSEGTKDSSEVVLEAAKSNQYSVSAEASFGMTGFGGSVAASTSGESSESSREAKTQLNDTMMQTSSKLQRTSKVIVTTESEHTAEFSTSSEITNSNDEIAVTYVYSKLQRQYQISTFLAELNTVVYVAEHVPTWYELTESWFTRHAAALRTALLDPVYQSDLNRVAWSSRPRVHQASSIIRDGLLGLADKDIDYSTTSGSPPDPMAPLAQRYETQLNQHRESLRQSDLYDDSFRRIREHVWSNRLHYSRAIWMAEDPESRMLRFRDTEVPSQWHARWIEPTYDVNRWQFVPSSKRVPLSEMLDPTGPIGFSGNYAVYRMRKRFEWSSLLELLDDIRLPYLRILARVEKSSSSAADDFFVRAVPGPSLLEPKTYRARFDDGQLHVTKVGTNGSEVPTTHALPPNGGTVQLGEELRLVVDVADGETLASGVEFDVHVRVLPELQDPELKYIIWQEPLPSRAEESLVFTIEVLREMSHYLQDLTPILAGNMDWNSLSADQREAVRNSYHEYLMHRDHTRRLLLDTNNLVLNRIVDQSSSIEPFKSAHRYIDALSAAEALRKQAHEAERYKARVEAGDFSDPETEKIVVVDSDSIDPGVDVD